MKQRFIELLEKSGAKGNPEEAFNELCSKYSQSHRKYHNLKHIESCLIDFDSAIQLVKEPEQVEFAIWYHDAIYNTLSPGSEGRSAQMAFNRLIEAGLSFGFCEEVSDLIIQTNHKLLPVGINAEILTDIDLAIFGKPIKEFDEYEVGIREEYFWVPETEFRTVRKSILERFLNRREGIYSTEFFREKYGDNAKRNLEMSIARLG